MTDRTATTTAAAAANAAPAAARRPRIVILGGGFGGAYCAQALERRLRTGEADVLLIDANNYFIFFPLLVEAGTGSLEPRHAVVSIRNFMGRGRFLMADVEGIDLDRRAVRCRLPDGGERNEPYDHLVLALGSVTNLPPVPGVGEHTFQVKNMADAIGLRDHAIRMLELTDATATSGSGETTIPAARSALLHWVVVGGNFSGVEVAGEFDAFLRRATRDYPHVSPRDVKVTIVEMTDYILAALQDRDLSEYAADRLRRRGVDVLLNTSVKEVHADHVILSDGRRIDTRTVIWNAGIAINPLIRRVPALPVGERGYVLCERDLRVRGMKTVWGIGDCAVNIDADGKPYPATAQHAVRQGAHLAANIVRVLRGEPTTPCNLKNLGGLAAIGCRTGVAKIMGIKLSGFLAWFLWRSVYLMKMPGWSRRFRIALDWTADLLFRQDHVQLGVHRRAMDNKDSS
jgi:NADH dehydrogenase